MGQSAERKLRLAEMAQVSRNLVPLLPYTGEMGFGTLSQELSVVSPFFESCRWHGHGGLPHSVLRVTVSDGCKHHALLL